MTTGQDDLGLLSTEPDMTVLFFAGARDAAGVQRISLHCEAGSTVTNLVGWLRSRFGAPFEAVLPTCAVWVNGLPAQSTTPLHGGDEIALLPPVSGG